MFKIFIEKEFDIILYIVGSQNAQKNGEEKAGQNHRG